MAEDSKEDLIERLRQDPGNEELWGVYGDLLGERGEKGAELISTGVELVKVVQELEELEKKKDELLHKHSRLQDKRISSFLKDHPSFQGRETPWDLRWQFGQIRRITLYPNEITREEEPLLEELCTSSYTRFVKELCISERGEFNENRIFLVNSSID